MKHKPRKTSLIIAEIVESCIEDDTVTVGEFLQKMGHKALVIAILVFAISAVIAGIVPGFSTLMAVPIIFMSLQMALGRNTIYLPRRIREKHISPAVIRGALSQSIPTLRKVEKFLRPRLQMLLNPLVERLVALVIMVMAIVLSLPIPMGNFLPSFSIAVLSLALLERDGVLLLLAVAFILLTGGLMVDLIVGALHFLQGVF